MADSAAIAIVSLVVAGSVSLASPIIASVAAGRRQRNEFEAKVVLVDRKELRELFDQGGEQLLRLGWAVEDADFGGAREMLKKMAITQSQMEMRLLSEHPVIQRFALVIREAEDAIEIRERWAAGRIGSYHQEREDDGRLQGSESMLFESWHRYSSAVRNAIGSELTPLQSR
jgi:hypothetical protein